MRPWKTGWNAGVRWDCGVLGIRCKIGKVVANVMEDHMGISAGWPSCLSASSDAQLSEARRIILHEADVLIRVAAELRADFCHAIALMQRTRGCIIVTGVGKAGLIGQKVVATLSSTGTNARFLHPTEALHGDLGAVSGADTVLAFSNSGESDEILRLMPAFAAMDVAVIAVTRDTNNSLARAARVTIAYGRHREAGELALAPSSTTTAMLAIGDAVALVLSQAKGFTSGDFARRHPGGSLGRKLTPVADVMRRGDQLRIARECETVRDVMVGHSRIGRRTGAVILIADTGVVTGVFTDSDLVRILENRRDDQIDGCIRDVMTQNPVTITADALLPQAIHLMSSRKLSELPVIDDQHRPLGMLDITDVLQYMDETQQQQFIQELRIVVPDAA